MVLITVIRPAPGLPAGSRIGPRIENVERTAIEQSTACSPPAQLLDLSVWKLTLPTGSAGSPEEVNEQSLSSYGGSQWFRATPDCDGVAFRAPVDGVTTKGSSYPRSELREMGAGNQAAAWSADSGTHWLAVTEAFTSLPQGKPELVGAQIHDDKDDVSVFRLEGSKLYITNGDNPHYKLVTDAYQLGTVFDAAFLVTNGMVGAYYNGQLVAQISRSFSNAYFKVGAYTQANCARVSPCDEGNYGETVVYSLAVGHE
jgi:hypothetical protein